MRDVLWLFVGVCLLGCLKDRAALDAECAFNDECTAPLVCAARRCRAPCRSDRDCTNLLRCRPSGQYRQRVCLPPDAPVPCLFSSECNAEESGTVCLRDGLCHRQCERNYDCQVYTAGSTCLPGGVCSFNPCLGQDAGCGARPAPSDAGSEDAPSDAPSDATPAVDAGPVSCALRSAPWACQPGAPGCAVEQVAVGSAGVCARFSDGTLRCWSSDRGDILANGRNERCPVPGLVQNLPGRALDVAVGGSAVCARTTLGVYCWGQNRNGELALGRPPDAGPGTELSPQLSMVPADARIFLAWSQGCAIGPTGALSCWGQASVGDGTDLQRSVPTPVTSLSSGVLEVVPGGIPSCALRDDGSVWCWGRDQDGALGRGPGPTGPSSVPVRVALSRAATSVRVGSFGGCALLDDRTVHCWGAIYNDGTTRRQSSTPVPMAGLSDVRDLTHGGGFLCARLGDGTAYCWGAIYGLGIGPMTFGGGTPVRVPGFDGALSFSAANGTVCARYPNAEVRCLGRNVGDGSPSASMPVRVTW